MLNRAEIVLYLLPWSCSASFVNILNTTASILTVASENPNAQSAGAWVEDVSMDLRFIKISGVVNVSCALPDLCGKIIFNLAVQVIRIKISFSADFDSPILYYATQ